MPKAKSERKRLVAQLDKVFSEYIRKRDGACVCCGAVENLQCGHLFTRAAYSTRWHERNAHAQCRSCNMRHEYDTYEYTTFFLNMYGRDEYDRLHKIHCTPRKFSNGELKALIERYREALNGMDATVVSRKTTK